MSFVSCFAIDLQRKLLFILPGVTHQRTREFAILQVKQRLTNIAVGLLFIGWLCIGSIFSLGWFLLYLLTSSGLLFWHAAICGEILRLDESLGVVTFSTVPLSAASLLGKCFPRHTYMRAVLLVAGLLLAMHAKGRFIHALPPSLVESHLSFILIPLLACDCALGLHLRNGR